MGKGTIGKAGRIAWWTVCSILAGGCAGDLKIVHTPDLWTLDAKAEQKARPGNRPQSTSTPATAFGIARLYTSLLPVQALTDADPETIAAAPDPAAKDQFILIDLGCMRTISQIRMLHDAEGGHPQKYRVDVAGEHNYPYSLVLVDQGTPGETVGVLRKPALCRFLRVTLLCPSEDPWRVRELTIH